MNITERQAIKMEYEAILCDKVQILQQKRKVLRITQQVIADESGFSLRSVQNLERYKSLNPMLIFMYSRILKKYKWHNQKKKSS